MNLWIYLPTHTYSQSHIFCISFSCQSNTSAKLNHSQTSPLYADPDAMLATWVRLDLATIGFVDTYILYVDVDGESLSLSIHTHTHTHTVLPVPAVGGVLVLIGAAAVRLDLATIGFVDTYILYVDVDGASYLYTPTHPHTHTVLSVSVVVRVVVLIGAAAVRLDLATIRFVDTYSLRRCGR